MRHEQSTTIYNIGESISFCEAQGLALCFQAYADNCAGEYIMDSGIGFNSSSGYVYITLENGIGICSCLGQAVEYLVTNFETDEESFFESYEEAEEFSQRLTDEA